MREYLLSSLYVLMVFCLTVVLFFLCCNLVAVLSPVK